MRTIGALIRAAWLTAMSYRVQTVISLLTLWVTVIPVYFIATALQPTMASAIRNEGTQYFPFMLIGTFAVSLISICVATLPGAVEAGISSGFFEGVLMTRAPRVAILAGLSAYPILWAVFRGALMLAAGALFGARIAIGSVVPALGILALIVVVHWAIGLIGAALVVAFRTSGPLSQAVVVASTLLGGAYYPTSVIPSWIQSLASFVPAAYGLRALRRVLLDGAPVATVSSDVLILAAITAGTLVVGVVAFRAALGYAGRRGTLSHL
ncbi:MAG: ABC transporter permease [Gemmatimonadaceae bacterium]|nr:ABC transporter permease [Gemmatimonadaceae bacterium]